MKLRLCAAAGRWMFVGALAAGTLAARSGEAVAQAPAVRRAPTGATIPTVSMPCDGTITTALDAAGAPRPVCVTEQPSPAASPASTPAPAVASTSVIAVEAPLAPPPGALPGTGEDTRFGIIVGAVLVLAGCATSLCARRRKL
ncbi:MAG: hypothetical protein JWM12_1613 [Ilumatobacteraceae bacterium]|jgi:hypothetical protein|nr:hypothetical protein [Ilumatobacteraceae bacterium]